MSFFNKSFNQINIEDIKNLITQEITESQNLEYKKEVWRLDKNIDGGYDEKIREMLKDISSMANKYGGYFIIGLEEERESGKALRLCNVPNVEQERDRIFNSIIANIHPRIPSLNIRCLDNENGKIIIIHIPNSLRKPHQIMFKGYNQFWIRHDRQKSPMSVEEIRDAFLKSFDITENVKDFLQNRKKDILGNVESEPVFVLGAYPLGSYGEIVDTGDDELREKLKQAPNTRYGGWNLDFTRSPARPSFYGLKLGDVIDWRQLELHRNAYLEAQIKINASFLDKTQVQTIPPSTNKITKNIMNGYAIIEYIFSFTKQLKQISEHIGYEGQYLIYISFYNIYNYGLSESPHERSFFNDELQGWKKIELEINPLTYDYVEPVKITKELGDRIWQSFGFEHEPFYKDGEIKFE